MENIDFNQSEKAINHQILHSNDNVDKSNSYMIFDYYRFLNYLRHNFLHLLILKMLGKPWAEERKVGDVFPITMPDEYSRKTPDIIILHNNKYYIIDVSISIDIHKTKKGKEKRYPPICDYLNKNNINCDYIHINIMDNDSNIYMELKKLDNLKINNFDQMSYFRMRDIITSKKIWVNQHIDKEIFNQLKEQEYNSLSEDNDEQLLFKDRLRHENYGKYNDIKINKEAFNNFNSKYDHLQKIEQNLKNVDEDVITNYLKNILEDEKNEIHKKYKDEILTSSQFDDALKKINEINNKTLKTYAKPTHHLMIPHDDDNEQTNDEQQSLVEFMKEYLKNVERLSSVEKNNNKLFFFRDVFSEIIWSLEDSQDKEINNNLL